MKNPTKTSVFALRLASASVLLALYAGLEMFASTWPPVLRAGIPAGAAWLVGKYLGVPTHAVTQLALARMAPEMAVQIVVRALQSLPPQRAEAATATLLASLPPPARSTMPPPPPPTRLVTFIDDEPSTHHDSQAVFLDPPMLAEPVKKKRPSLARAAVLRWVRGATRALFRFRA